MKKESLVQKKKRGIEVCQRMAQHYPKAKPALDFDNDVFRLTIAVLLSAQTTDAAVNKATPLLWERYPHITDLAAADVNEVGEIIHSIGFHNTKARNCIACAQMVLSDYGGEVPASMEELQRLPGVGRKTANIVMNTGFRKACGIAVDTHVFRIAHRLQLSSAKDANQTECDLLKIIPQEMWTDVNSQWILFGREICTAKKPACQACFLADICPSCGL